MIGIKESAGFNAAMVLLNIGVILTVVGVGAAYVDPSQLAAVPARGQGVSRRRPGGRPDLLRLHRLRLDLDPRRRGPQAPARPGDRHHGALVVCTVLYVAVAAVLTGMIPYRQIDEAAPLSAALQAKGLTFAGGMITLGILAGMTSSLLVGNLSQPRILLAMARDGLLPARVLRRRPSPVQDPLEIDDPGRRGRRPGGAPALRWAFWPTWSASAPCSRS